MPRFDFDNLTVTVSGYPAPHNIVSVLFRHSDDEEPHAVIIAPVQARELARALEQAAKEAEGE